MFDVSYFAFSGRPMCNRADHYIFALWFLSFFLLSPRLISAAVDCMYTILPHMVWP